MIVRKVKCFENWLANEPRQRIGIRALQIGLGGVFMFRAFTELPFASYLYGVGGIGDDFEFQSGNPIGLLFARFFHLDYGAQLLLLTLAACGICYIVDYRTRLLTFVSLITFNLIASRNTALGDGGDNIIQIILIYMLLLIPSSEIFKERGFKVWVHNLGVLAIGAQIMILYFTAGFMKISGEAWTSGIALFNVSQVEAFSVPLTRDIFNDPYITTIASYVTMILLIWFPIAMFSKLKFLWIFIGISFHLGIIGFMGLVTFGSTMIAMELFFLTDADFRKIASSAKRTFNMIRIYVPWRKGQEKVALNGGVTLKN